MRFQVLPRQPLLLAVMFVLMGGFAPTITITTAIRHILTPFKSSRYLHLILSANFSSSLDVLLSPFPFPSLSQRYLRWFRQCKKLSPGRIKTRSGFMLFIPLAINSLPLLFLVSLSFLFLHTHILHLNLLPILLPIL